MAVLETFARGGEMSISTPRVPVFLVPEGWVVYYPPEVVALFEGAGALTAVTRKINTALANFVGSGTTDAEIFAIGSARPIFSGSGSLSAMVAASNADVGADFSGEGTFVAIAALPVQADFTGFGNLNPHGVVEIEITPALLDGLGELSATVGEVERAPAAFTGTGALSAVFSAQENFLPTAMNKSGSQALTSAYAQLNGWLADTANYPGSVVASNGLVAQGSAVGQSITATVAFSGKSFASGAVTARILRNGNVIGTGAGVAGSSGVATCTVVDLTVAVGDVFTVQVLDSATFYRATVQASGTHLRFDVVQPLILRASDNFDRPNGPLGPNWTTTGGGTLNIANGRINGVGTPSVPLSYAWWHEQMPSDTQVVRGVVRWDGYNPEHSATGLVLRANPFGTPTAPGRQFGVQFCWTRNIMALYFEDLNAANGFTPVTGVPAYVSTSKFPEGAIVELRAEGNLYTARVNGAIMLQGTVENSVIPFSNRHVGVTIQDDSAVTGGGGPPGRLDDFEALTP